MVFMANHIDAWCNPLISAIVEAAAEFTAEDTANILVNQDTSPCGGARAPYSRTTVCSFASSFHKLYISCWAWASLLQPPINPTVTRALTG